jgi:hypothetical protein
MNKRGNGLISRRYIRYGFCDYDIETYRVMNCVYFVTDGEFVKIGIAKLFAKRLSGLQTGSSRELKPLCVCIFDNFILAQKYEKLLHDYFFEKRVRGEWFKINENDIKSAKDKFNLTMHRCI